MTKMLLTILLALPVLLAAASDGYAGKLEAFSDKEVHAAADSLAREFKMPDIKRVEVLERLREILAHDGFKRARGNGAVRGIVAYTIGEGGLVVKFLSGRGLVAFKGRKDRPRLSFKSTSVGAQIGGSKEWGVGLIMDLSDASHLGGTYTGSVKGAIAATTGKMVSRLERSKPPSPEMGHELWLIGTAEGLSANFGTTRLTIAVRDGMQAPPAR